MKAAFDRQGLRLHIDDSFDDNQTIVNMVSRGFGIYYYAPVSREAAQCVYETMCADGGDENIGLHQENFYVCRTSWAPALLIEAGFMPNARDFECLIDPAYREAFAGTLAGAITVWFADKE